MNKITLNISIYLGFFCLTVPFIAPATNFFTITSPANNANVNGTIYITGTAGTQWVNVAAYNTSSVKVANDVTPSAGTYTLTLNTTVLPNGTDTVRVVAFSVPAGQPGGIDTALNLILNVSNSGVTAIRANDFLNSIGVCTHITQGIDNPSNVSTALQYTGIRNIRDDGSANSSILQKFISVHNSCGAKFSLLPINGNVNASISEWETLAAAGALLAAEGPNEPNNWAVTYQGQTSSSTTSLPIAKFQKDLYAAVKADSNLKGIPVFHSSESGGSEPDNCGLQFLTIPNGAGTLMPDGTVYADYANTHNYVCDHLSSVTDNDSWQAEDPTLNGAWDGLYVEYGHTWWSPGYNGYSNSQLLTLPRVTTETGWITSGSNSITEDQQGRLFLTLYLDAYKRGWSYTFVYMLHDDNGQGYWGFIHTDYSNKPSATYLHNMTTILSDNSSSFGSGTINYTIPGEPATVHDMLLQKSNGLFELAVWGEKASGTNTVTVNLGASYPSVNIYDPVSGTSAVQTLNNVSSVNLTLNGYDVNILEITPGTTTGESSLQIGVPELQVSPNPASGYTTLTYFLSDEAVVCTEVLDALGRQVLTLPGGKQSAGMHAVHLNTEELNEGVYFIRLTAGGKVVTRKLVRNNE